MDFKTPVLCVAFHSLCLVHGKPAVIDNSAGGPAITPEVFEEYDAAAGHSSPLQQSEIHAGTFAPITTGHSAAAASKLDTCIYPVSASAAPTLGPSIPPTSRLFADLVLEDSGSGGGGALATTNMGHFSAMHDPLPELLPTDDEEEDTVTVPQRPAATAPVTVSPPTPTISFFRCGVGTSFFNKSSLLATAVLCSLLFSAAGISAAADVHSIPEGQHSDVALYLNHSPAFVPDCTLFCRIPIFTIRDVPHLLQFACALHQHNTPPVVYCASIPCAPPWMIDSGYFSWAGYWTTDWFWTLGLVLVTFLVSGIYYFWTLVTLYFDIYTDNNSGFFRDNYNSELHTLHHSESG
ncbi:hypothetical protein CYMTET_47482 [Cymbomonas tetramitiformis]|uniref:Uncharacterized protein n=1 Tax=Cymbomonas tetramitiformis TaxID=36881 RepID=A0AAE0EWM5_9CHLO|nr:hypothetical protein CYMTET_47482 [Cymbomonas tetramitiformis]